MKKLDKILDDVMRFLMAFSMLSLVVGGFWQIFSRWILKDPSTFTEEFMRYMLIWASMLGVAVEAMNMIGATAADIAAIGITNQRETTIVWDKNNTLPWICLNAGQKGRRALC